jgi:SAP domain
MNSEFSLFLSITGGLVSNTHLTQNSGTLKVPALKELLRSRQLPHSGKKQVLVGRLDASDRERSNAAVPSLRCVEHFPCNPFDFEHYAHSPIPRTPAANHLPLSCFP